MEQRQHKGLCTVSDGLKHGDDDKQQRVDRNGNAQDAQELRAIENRIRVADEKADHFRREKPGDQAPDKGKAHRADGGKPDHFPHPLLPPGGIAIRYDGQHALRDALIYRVRHRVELSGDADPGNSGAGSHSCDHAVQKAVGKHGRAGQSVGFRNFSTSSPRRKRKIRKNSTDTTLESAVAIAAPATS